jgi:hypothetical protein
VILHHSAIFLQKPKIFIHFTGFFHLGLGYGFGHVIGKHNKSRKFQMLNFEAKSFVA